MNRFLLVICSFFAAGCIHHGISKFYGGTPFHQQSIPGKIECEWYDKGGESIAYHDSDKINNGSGKLNPVNGNPLNEFRMQEGVDISYTKTGGIDNNPFDVTQPVMNQLYVGWTQPGEWVNYTIKVNKAALYRVAAMYTANGDGGISFDIDNRPLTGSLKILSTHNDADTVAWRQWHHWNRVDSLTTIKMPKGYHVLTLHIRDHGNMNFDYLLFTKL
jgi:Carbohydrate binding module (family 6)